MQFAVCRFADLPHPRAWKVGGAVLKSEWCWEWWKQWGSNLRCSSFQILNRCRSIKYISKNIHHSWVSVAQWIRCWTPNGGVLGSIPVWGWYILSISTVVKKYKIYMQRYTSCSSLCSAMVTSGDSHWWVSWINTSARRYILSISTVVKKYKIYMRRYTSSFSSNGAVETLSAKDWWFPGSNPGSITSTNQIPKCRYLQFLTLRLAGNSLPQWHAGGFLVRVFLGCFWGAND